MLIIYIIIKIVMKKYIPFQWDFPLSQAIIHNKKYTMEISGIIGINYESKMLEKWIKSQTKRVMENIKSTLKQVWWDMTNIVKSRIFLVDMWDYEAMNEIYAEYFTWECPTRFTIEVNSLPAGALVEIECSATWNNIK